MARFNVLSRLWCVTLALALISEPLVAAEKFGGVGPENSEDVVSSETEKSPNVAAEPKAGPSCSELLATALEKGQLEALLASRADGLKPTLDVMKQYHIIGSEESRAALSLTLREYDLDFTNYRYPYAPYTAKRIAGMKKILAMSDADWQKFALSYLDNLTLAVNRLGQNYGMRSAVRRQVIAQLQKVTTVLLEKGADRGPEADFVQAIKAATKVEMAQLARQQSVRRVSPFDGLAQLAAGVTGLLLSVGGLYLGTQAPYVVSGVSLSIIGVFSATVLGQQDLRFFGRRKAKAQQKALDEIANYFSDTKACVALDVLRDSLNCKFLDSLREDYNSGKLFGLTDEQIAYLFQVDLLDIDNEMGLLQNIQDLYNVSNESFASVENLASRILERPQTYTVRAKFDMELKATVKFLRQNNRENILEVDALYSKIDQLVRVLTALQKKTYPAPGENISDVRIANIENVIGSLQRRIDALKELERNRYAISQSLRYVRAGLDDIEGFANDFQDLSNDTTLGFRAKAALRFIKGLRDVQIEAKKNLRGTDGAL